MRGLEEIQGLEVGTLIAGKYRVDRLLAKGAMGAVVAATHVELAELRAIKLLLPSTAADPEMCARFLREARIAARLRSEHAVKVHEVGRFERLPFMVMQFLAGRDLRVVRKKRGPLPVEEATLYVIQACDALAEAHALGLVHRDVKPANLFLTRARDGSPCIKVLDFGVSKVSVQGAASLGFGEMQTSTGQMLGTPHYMPPEQMRGQRDVDARADIWAIGSLLYVLLTGRYPMHARSVETVSLVLGGKFVPPPPSEVRRGLTPAIDPIILRCLERDRDRRWPDVAELVLALRPFAPPAAQPLVERIQRVLREGPYDAPASARVSVDGASASDHGSIPPASSSGPSTGGVAIPLHREEPLPAVAPPSLPRAETVAGAPREPAAVPDRAGGAAAASPVARSEAAAASDRAGGAAAASPVARSEAAAASDRAGGAAAASPVAPREAAVVADRSGAGAAAGSVAPGEAALVEGRRPAEAALEEMELVDWRPRSALASRLRRLVSPSRAGFGAAALTAALVAVVLVSGAQRAELSDPPEQAEQGRAESSERWSGARAPGPAPADAPQAAAGSVDSAGQATPALAAPTASQSSRPLADVQRGGAREQAPRAEHGPPARAAAAPRLPASRSVPAPGPSARRQAISISAAPR
ncbi:protein kinase domain-containing protein [Sorangium sp. So ce1335]|uniref:serine/threonine-protein kinase n=1 Tax=Sorangium sp. So ce1335 TaxID=3133335 RepID=UPI003F5E7C59